jgi:hypothetical protein
MMAVSVETEGRFKASAPRVLFEGNFERSGGPDPNYDVSNDGQRFVMIKGADDEPLQNQINIVLNWFEELKRLVPTESN